MHQCALPLICFWKCKNLCQRKEPITYRKMRQDIYFNSRTLPYFPLMKEVFPYWWTLTCWIYPSKYINTKSQWHGAGRQNQRAEVETTLHSNVALRLHKGVLGKSLSVFAGCQKLKTKLRYLSNRITNIKILDCLNNFYIQLWS